MALAGRLPMREQQNALFTQRIAPITGQHMHQVMRVTLTMAEPLDEIVIARTARFGRFLDQARRRQALALHEIAIGMRHRTLGHLPQRVVIVEDRREVRFALAQRLPLRVQGHRAHPRQETR